MAAAVAVADARGAVRRLWGRYAAVAAMTVVVVVIGPEIDAGRTSASLDVALGVFAALLTALTVALALTLDVGSRWPPLLALVVESVLPAWFAVSGAAIVVSGLSGANTDSPGLLLGFWGALLGVWSLSFILWAASDRGRRRFLGGLLEDRLRRADQGAAEAELGANPATAGELASFLRAVDSAIDAGDVAELHDRVEEAVFATGRLPATCLPTGLNLELALVARLGKACLMGRLTTTEVGAVLIPRLGERIVAQASRLRPDERAAAVYLGQLARLVAWQAHTAHATLVRQAVDPPHLLTLIRGSARVRRAIVVAVDPDPPRERRPSDDPWTGGLTDPLAVLLWQWAFVEFNPTHLGRDLYAVTEVLTGEKFHGSVGWGNRCPLTEIARRLAEPELDPTRTRARDTLTAIGGLESASLELLATSLATWRPRAWRAPQGFEGAPAYTAAPFRLARRARLFTLRQPGDRLQSLTEALDALAELTSGAGRERSLWNEVRDAYARLPGVAPPLAEPSERPGACVLAVALRLAPLERADFDRQELVERFFAVIPSRLRLAALDLAEETFALEQSPGVDRSADRQVAALAACLEFLFEDRQPELAAR